ncbi:MAG: NmrA family NAD(P)-binding protein [Cyanobacteriota bacterium]
MKDQTHIVTGAFGYTGRYIARELINRNIKVITLSNALNRPDYFNGSVKKIEFSFDNHELLVNIMKQGSVLYNTYWVRFNCKEFNFNQAITNSKKIINAAKEAGINRIVHISVTNAEKGEGLEYFEGKKTIEDYIINSGLPYTIIRPALIFAEGDILINNIAWCLRRFPFFILPGKGEYKLNPVFAEDLAKACVDVVESEENDIIDVVGPECFTFKEFVELIACSIDYKRPIISASPDITHLFSEFISLAVKDPVITRDEIKGLTRNLLYSGAKPAGLTKFSDWIKENSSSIGQKYAGEMIRRLYK